MSEGLRRVDLVETPRAENQRRYRQRQAAGRIVLRIEVDEFELAAAMIDDGALTPDEAQHREYLERGAALVLKAWIARYR